MQRKAKFNRFLSLFMAFAMMLSLLPMNVFATGGDVGDGAEPQVESTFVAKIDTEEYKTFSEALTAASAMTDDVTVEIYDKVTLNTNLSGSYASIKFVGKDTDAEIYLDVQGYITATGKTVAFEDLTLSKSVGGFIDNAGFMNVAFGVYDVVEVTYTKCTFTNGAYASSGEVTYTGCTFYRSHDKYGLWAYGNVDVTVDGSTFADYRGIKMYAEGAAKTTKITVKNSDFSKLTGKPAIVATLGDSITLSGNTYSGTGVLELEDNGSSNGIKIDSTDTVTCISDAYPNGCGVLVGNRIYRTVADAAVVAKPGDTVTLLHDSSESVKFAEGVTLNKNGHTADGVTVTQPVITEVATYDELVAALANGGNIKLTSDITVDTKITVVDGTVIDLNDKTLYVNVENSYYNNATIKNGNVVLGKDDVDVCDGYFLVNAGKTLVLNDVNMSSADDGIKGYAVFHLKTGANLDLIDSTLNISNNEYSAGYIVYAGEGTATLDVTGTTIIGSKVNGVVHATTVIDDSTFTLTDVVEHGINRSGVTINDSTVAISGGTGRGITAQHGDLLITGTSNVTVTDMGEATIELRDNKNMTVAETATVTVDAPVNNTTSGTITGSVTVDMSVGAVAQIGDKYYKTLQAAIDAVQNGDTITLLADCDDDVTVVQAPDVAFTIDGKKSETENFTYTGTITVDGKSAAYATAGLTIQNVNFDATNISKDASINLGGNNNIRYTSNVTVKNCTFTGTDNTAAAIKNYTGGCKNLTVTGCTAEGMHSLVQVKGVAGLKVTGCTVTNGKNGISVGTSTNVAISECNITATGYGVRADGNATSSMTVTGCTISAEKPIIVRKVTEGADYALTLSGTNNLTAPESAGYKVIFTSGDDEAAFEEPTTAQAVVTLNNTNVTYSDIFGAYYEAEIGGVKYASLQEAVNAGGEVKVLRDITLTDTVTIPADKAVTLDLNGKTISQEKAQNAAYAMITNNGTLTITDLSEDGNGKISYADTADYTGAVNYASNTIKNNGVLNVEGGTIENISSEKVKEHGYPHAIDVYPGSVTNITGGTVKSANYDSIRMFCNSADKATIVNISGDATIVNRVTFQHPSNKIVANGVLNITGGTFTSTDDVTANVRLLAFGTDFSNMNAQITGGTFDKGVGISDYTGSEEGVTWKPVTGGKFKSSSVIDYLADGYVLGPKNSQGYYGIELSQASYVASVNGTDYLTLQAAVDAIGTSGTIYMKNDAVLTDTLTIPAGKTIVLEMNGKTISQSKACTASYSMIENKGNLTITGNGEISFTDTGAGDPNFGWGSYTITNRGTLVVENGTIENLSAQNNRTSVVHMYCAIQQAGGIVTINDGKISNPTYRSVRVNKGDLVINGGTFEGQVWLQPNQGDVTLTVTGGTFAPSGADGSSIFMTNVGENYTVSSAAISGGTFTTKIGASDAAKLAGSITGGSFSEAAVTGTNKALLQYGLTFGEANAEGYCGLVEMEEVAQIGETKYYALDDALKAAQAGDTVTLLENIVLEKFVTIDKSITLDLNEKTITRESGTGLYINNADAEVVIKNGSVEASGEAIYVNSAEKVDIYNVSAKSTGKAPAVYMQTSGVVNIYSGTFETAEKHDGAYFTLNIYDSNRANCTINVYGGTFVNFNPANNTAEGADTNFVPEGYAALPNLDGGYVVGTAPTATVNNLGAMTVPANEYYIYNGSLTTGTVDMPLNFVMQFVADQDAEDMQTSPFASWYADFVITFEDIEGDSFDPTGCYLAGYYGSTDSWDGMWVKIPVEGLLESIEEGTRYPVMMGVGMAQTYDYICSGVQAFSCAMYIPQEILEANPNLKVKLELNIVDSSNGNKALEALQTGDKIYKASETSYTAEDFAVKVAKIGETYYKTFDEAYTAAEPGETIELLADVTLTSKLIIKKAITIDGNGHSIIADGDTTWYTTSGKLQIKNYAPWVVIQADGVVLKNLTIDSNNVAGGVKVENAENVTFDKVSIVGTKADALTVVGSVNFKTYFKAESPSTIIDARSGVVTAEAGTEFDMTKWQSNVSPATSDLKGAVDKEGNPFFAGYNSTTYIVDLNAQTSLKDVTLLKDVALAKDMSASGSLNLNSHNLTVADGKALKVASNLTVTGGTVNAEFRLTSVSATVTGPETLNVTTSLEGCYVAYENGKHVVKEVVLPEVVITDIKDSLTGNDPDLTFALNFAIKDMENLDEDYLEALFATYGSHYVDYVLTISGLSDTDVTFNANGNADGYLAGQYDAWSTNWVSVPFEDVTVQNGQSLYIMEYAAKLMGQSGLRFTLLEVAEIVQNFDCGVYFTPEFLAANPNMKVDLELKVFTEDAEGNKIENIDVATNSFNAADFGAVIEAENKQSQYFETFAEAYAAAKDGETITLLKDVEVTESIRVTNTVTVDLNGQNLIGPDDGKANWYAFIVDGGNLTLKDSVGNGELFAKCYGVETKSGTFTMESGKITATENKGIGAAIVNYGGTVTVNGGTISGAVNAVYTAGYFSDAATTINGGTIYGPVTIENYDTKDFTESVASASNTYQIAEGYEWIENGSMYNLGLTRVAQIGETKYESLQEAVNAAKAGATITVIEDHAVAESVIVDKQVTIDLNGKTVSAAQNLSSKPVFRILADVTVTDGTVDGTTGINSYAFIVGSNDAAGTLNIADGTYKGVTSAVSVTKGTANISGGTFSTGHDDEGTDYGAQYLLNLIDGNDAQIVVTGGTFVGFDPMNNAAEGAGTNFCAAGYISVESSTGDTSAKTYTVVPSQVAQIVKADGTIFGIYGSLGSALTEAQKLMDGEYRIELLRDTCEDTVVLVPGMTLDLNGCELVVQWMTAFKGANVIDQIETSSEDESGTLTVTREGTGLLKTKTEDSQINLAKANDSLPLYDQSAQGYRFYEYELQQLGAKGEGDKAKFGYRILFEDNAAYALLAEVTSQVEFATDVNWTGLDYPIHYTFSADTVTGFIKAYMGNQKLALTLTISGLSVLDSGDKIYVVPVIETALGVGTSGTTNIYTIQ